MSQSNNEDSSTGSPPGKDLGDRQPADEALRESEEKHRRLVEAAGEAEEALRRERVFTKTLIDGCPIFFVALDRDGKTLMLNQTMLNAFGYTAEEVVGKEYLSIFVPEEEHEALGEIFRSLITFGYPRVNENHVLARDGRRILVEWHGRSAFKQNGDFDYFFGVGIDITERKLAEEALKESEERYRRLVELSPDSIMILDFDGTIRQVNSEFERSTGWKRDEVGGKRLQEICLLSGDESRKLEREIVPRLMQEGSVRNVRSTGFRKDGSRFPALISWTLMEGADNWPAGIIAVARDITESKLAEEKLLDYQNQLRSLASELSLAEERERRQIATELHDRVGQTLAASKLKLAALRYNLANSDLSESVDEILSLIEQTIQDARSLTREISPPVLYELGFEAAVQWLAEQFEEQNNITTEFKNDEQPKPLRHDIRVVLFQAVRELLVNVAKHAHAQTVKVALARRRNTIAVNVQDNGVGFETSQIGPHRDKAGGFGLFNIRERLRHLGGRLEIESQPGRGTRFTLIAPLSDGLKARSVK